MDDVLLTWDRKNDKRFLRFSFKGHLTEEVAKSAISNWKKEFGSNVTDGERVNIIWNCLEMKKYSPLAAKVWKNALLELSDKIDDIWLITTNPFFKMGARTMTMLTSFKLRSASSESEITYSKI